MRDVAYLGIFLIGFSFIYAVFTPFKVAYAVLDMTTYMFMTGFVVLAIWSCIMITKAIIKIINKQYWRNKNG